jgi:hypothetical protein
MQPSTAEVFPILFLLLLFPISVIRKFTKSHPNEVLIEDWKWNIVL